MYKYSSNNLYEKILFFSALFLNIFCVYIQCTDFIKYFSTETIKKICILCIMLLIAKIAIFDLCFWLNNLIAFIGIMAILIISVKSSGVPWYDSVLTFGLLILSARNIDFTETCDFIFKITAMFLLITILFYYFFGFYRQPINIEGRIRRYLGFSYVTIGHIRFIGTAFCGLYAQHNKRKKGASWLFLIVIFGINCYFYIYTKTRLSFVIISFMLVIYVFIYKLNVIRIRCRSLLIKLFYILSAVLLIGSLTLPKLYDDSNGLWRFINYKLTNTRLSLSKVALNRYNLGFFGQSIKMTNNDMEGYFYIDSGYLHNSLLYGIVFVAILVLVYLMVGSEAIYKNNWILTVWIVCLIMYNVMNEWMISVDKCACAFAIWDCVTDKCHIYKNDNYLFFSPIYKHRFNRGV